MTLAAIITDNFQCLHRDWTEAFYGTYGAGDFLKRPTNRFANPVGANISEALEGILQHLRKREDICACRPFLDNIIRIRAVQEFSPSQAMAPFYAITRLLRSLAEKGNSIAAAEWEHLESLLLLAFDIYMECREQLYRAQAKEIASGRRMITREAVCPSVFLDRTCKDDDSQEVQQTPSTDGRPGG